MIHSFRIEQYQHYVNRLTAVIACGKNNQYQLFYCFFVY